MMIGIILSCRILKILKFAYRYKTTQCNYFIKSLHDWSSTKVFNIADAIHPDKVAATFN